MRSRTFCSVIVCLVAVAVTAQAGSPSSPGLGKDKAILAEFEIADDGDLPVIPVTLSGREYQFIVDTGTSHTNFDSRLRARLTASGRRIEFAAGARITEVDLFHAPELHLGGLRVPPGLEVVCLDLRSMADSDRLAIAGIIGTDVMSRYVVQLDLAAGRLRFLGAVPKDAGDELPLCPAETLAGRPALVLRAFGEDSHFLLDTGFAGTVTIGGGEFHRAVRAGAITELGRVGHITIGGCTESAFGRAEALRIGEFRLDGVRVDVASPIEGRLLGTRFLARYIVTLDFPNRRAFFKQSTKAERGEDWEFSGLGVLPTPDGFAVETLEPFSPSIEAGVRLDDVVVAVDGAPVDRMRTVQFMNLFRRAGRTVELTLLRGEIELKVQLKLREFRKSLAVAGP